MFAPPREFCLKFGYADETPSTLRNVQFEPVKCYGVRDMILKSKTGTGSWIDAVIKFDVADVAYPVPNVTLFTWLVRHAGCAMTRFMPKQGSKQTAFERSCGKSYKSPRW